MSGYDFNLITIGAGSGGVRASRMAGAYGAKVAVIEEIRAGGTCVLRGCVPKKLMVYGSHLLEEINDARGYGWSVGEVRHDWPAMIKAKNTELDRLHGIYVRLLVNAGVEIIDGRGTLVDAHTVAVGARRITAERIMIAVGGWPTVPKIPGVEHAITSNEALELPQRPQRIVIVGGGYIAVEFAGIFNAFGSQVDLVFRADKILRGFDEDMRETLGVEMAKKGVRLHAGCLPERIEKTDGALTVRMNDGSVIECDAIMYATGRAPNTAGLGLAEAGVVLNGKGAVQVDEWGRTSLDNVYAVGDVTDRINLTPVAIAEGRAFAETVYNNNPIKADHENVPAAVFSQPPVCGVGLPEHEARTRFGAIDVYVSGFRPMKFTLTENPERGLLKLIVDRATDRVVGAHMVGIDAPEIIQGLAIAVKMGATKAQFDATVGIHPTAAEEFVTMREKRPEAAANAAG
jgi:glutathione reductase (NADPH)